LAVSPQQRVRRDHRRDVTQGFSTEPMSPYGKSSPVVVCQPHALHTDLSPKKAILFNEISHRLPLPAIEPPMTARSSNWRAETSITSGSLYHARGKELCQSRRS
jgi:hypothetical protein